MKLGSQIPIFPQQMVVSIPSYHHGYIEHSSGTQTYYEELFSITDITSIFGGVPGGHVTRSPLWSQFYPHYTHMVVLGFEVKFTLTPVHNAMNGGLTPSQDSSTHQAIHLLEFFPAIFRSVPATDTHTPTISITLAAAGHSIAEHEQVLDIITTRPPRAFIFKTGGRQFNTYTYNNKPKTIKVSMPVSSVYKLDQRLEQVREDAEVGALIHRSHFEVALTPGMLTGADPTHNDDQSVTMSWYHILQRLGVTSTLADMETNYNLYMKRTLRVKFTQRNRALSLPVISV